MPLTQPGDERCTQARFAREIAGRIAQVAAFRTFGQRVGDRLGGRKVHVGHPEREDVRPLRVRFRVVLPLQTAFFAERLEHHVIKRVHDPSVTPEKDSR